MIKLGPGNDDAATDAMRAWAGGMHLGGGVNVGNAQEWLDKGAEKVRVAPWAARRWGRAEG